MSTSPEGHDPIDRTRGREPEPDTGSTPASGREPTFEREPGFEREPVAWAEAPTEEPVTTETDAAAAVPPEATTKPSGVVSTETFALTALFLLGITVFSAQLVELFTTVTIVGDQPVPVDQVAQFSIQTLIGGAMAAITALFAALALALAKVRTRPWARWLATAVLIVSVLLLILAIVTYVMMPTGTDPQPFQIPE